MGRKSNALERRGQIVWALYDCLVEKGHERVTIKEIAIKAGLPPGVIHYYFKSKNEIVSSMAAAMVEKYTSLINKRLSQAKSSDQRINHVIDFMIDTLIFNPSLNRVYYNLIQMAFERKELSLVVKNLLEHYRKQFARVFKEAGAGQDSDMLGAFLVSITEGFSLQIMVDPKAFDKKAVHKVLVQAVQDRLEKIKGLDKIE